MRNLCLFPGPPDLLTVAVVAIRRGTLKPKKFLSFDNQPHATRVKELNRVLSLYEDLRENREFQRDCREFDRLDAHTDVGNRHTSEAAVKFYLKWSVYPIPEFLVNDHNFRVMLEQFFLRNQRVFNIPVSPLTTKAELLHDFQQIGKHIRRPRKLPALKRLRVALIQKFLVDRSAFHEFKPSDFAAAKGSKPKRGKSWKVLPLNARETDLADKSLSNLVNQGNPYPLAEPRAMRQVTKQRWREAKLTPRIRMSTERALRTLNSLLFGPNK